MENIENIKSKCFSVYAYLKFMGEYASDQLTDTLDCEPSKVDFLYSTTTKFIETVQQKLATYASEMAKLSAMTLPTTSSLDSFINVNSSSSTILADIKDFKKDCVNLSLKRSKSAEEYTDDDILEVSRVEADNTKNEISNSCKESNFLNGIDSDETYCPELEDREADETVFIEMLDGLGKDHEDIASQSNISDVDFLLSSDISSTYSDSESPSFSNSLSSFDSEAENYKYTDEDYCEINGIKPCYIYLTDIVHGVQKNKRSVSEHDKEMREINRLTNMNTLDNLRGTSNINNISSTKRKRLQIETDDDSEVSTVPIEEDEDSMKDLDQLMCLENWSNSNDETEECDGLSCEEQMLAALGESYGEEESSPKNDEKTSKVKRMRKIKRRHKKILTSSSEEGDIIKNDWQRDPLLTARLSPILDDSKEEGCDEDSLLKIVRKEEVDDKNSIKTSGIDKSPHSTELVWLDSANESDCEFVGNVPKSEVRDKGRKNIRAIKPNQELEENTQLAQRNEKEHMQRVSEQTKKIKYTMSQQNDLLNTDLILDVDDEYNPLIVVDRQLSIKLKDHQKDGVRFMWTSCFESVQRIKTSNGTGCILAHCMGLGKTLQAITLIHTLFKYKRLTGTKHVLIVCPVSTAQNWKDEFEEMLKDVDNVDFSVILLSKKLSKAQKVNVIAKWHSEGGVLILGYESFVSLVKDFLQKTVETTSNIKYKALLNPGPDLMICDEGHSIRNKTNSRSICLKEVTTKRRIVLTGTPFQNNLEEMYYMVNFVKPNFLGTKDEFMNRFGNPILNGGYFDSTEADIKLMQKRSHVLHKYLNATVQRYEASELIKYVPDKYDYTILISMHPTQMELYNKYLSLVKSTTVINNSRFLYDYTMLRHIWSHPRLLKEHEAIKLKETCKETNDDVIITSNVHHVPKDWYHSVYPKNTDHLHYGPKLAIVMSIIEECEAIGEKIVIFSSSLLNLNCIEHFLKTNGTSRCKSWIPNVDYVRMDGSVPLDVRNECCKRFATEANIRVFLLSQKVGGMGLNFVAANRLILVDVHFNPAMDNQSVYRIVRFGQKRKCYIYRLVSKGTMEETVYERSVTKASISARVVDVKQIRRYFKRHDLEIMYRSCEISNTRPPMTEPKDSVLSKVLQKHKEIFQYHDYHSLLENQQHEQLNEREQQAAWEEFEIEREKARIESQQKAAIANIQQTLNPLQTEFNTPRDGFSADRFKTALNLTAIPVVVNEETSAAQTTNIMSIKSSTATPSVFNKEESKNFFDNNEAVLLINDEVLIQSEDVSVTKRSEIVNRTENTLQLPILPIATTNYKITSKNSCLQASLPSQNPSGSEIDVNRKNSNVESPSPLHSFQKQPERKLYSAKRRMSVPASTIKSVPVNVVEDCVNSSSKTSFHIREKFTNMDRNNHLRQSAPSGLTNKCDEHQKGKSEDVIEID